MGIKAALEAIKRAFSKSKPAHRVQVRRPSVLLVDAKDILGKAIDKPGRDPRSIHQTARDIGRHVFLSGPASLREVYDQVLVPRKAQHLIVPYFEGVAQATSQTASLSILYEVVFEFAVPLCAERPDVRKDLIKHAKHVAAFIVRRTEEGSARDDPSVRWARANILNRTKAFLLDDEFLSM